MKIQDEEEMDKFNKKISEICGTKFISCKEAKELWEKGKPLISFKGVELHLELLSSAVRGKKTERLKELEKEYNLK